MSLTLRIFLIYVVFMTCAGYFMVNSVINEIKPAIRQSTEETLVDTANLLAELLRAPLEKGELKGGGFKSILAAYGQRKPAASIWGVDKNSVGHRIYVTDNRGIVVFDSKGDAEGEDYSRWNDVLLTLRGEYGARSSTEMIEGVPSSVMYVAAPIVNTSGEMLGVVSVSKPNQSVQPFLDKARARLLLQSALVIGVGLLAGVLFSWWLSGELRRLRDYALSVSQGKRISIPTARLASGELQELALALESMRVELDGKAYVEGYVQTLAHEIRSPLTAISATAELLHSPMDDQQRQRFIDNIESESIRLQHMLNRLLELAKLEQQQTLKMETDISLRDLWDDLLKTKEVLLLQRNIASTNSVPLRLTLSGDRFLLRQALSNFLDNALDFCLLGGRLMVSAQPYGEHWKLCVFNTGPNIPDFALDRLTERFYSLARSSSGKKSTGLGLNFVQEVAKLHGGYVLVSNVEGGVEASLFLPSTLFNQ